MNAATDFANGRVRAAADLDWATCAIELTGSIKNDVGFGDVCAGVLERTPVAAQRVALRAAVFIVLLIPPKVATGQRVIHALSLVPQRNMRIDRFVVDHPTQQLSSAIGHVADQARWLYG